MYEYLFKNKYIKFYLVIVESNFMIIINFEVYYF